MTDCALERLHGRCRHLQRLNLSWCGRHREISAPGLSRSVTYFPFMSCYECASVYIAPMLSQLVWCQQINSPNILLVCTGGDSPSPHMQKGCQLPPRSSPQTFTWRRFNRLRVEKARCQAMMRMWKLFHGYRCMRLCGETASSYDMCCCPQLHVQRRSQDFCLGGGHPADVTQYIWRDLQNPEAYQIQWGGE